jgi:hypothetical protein
MKTSEEINAQRDPVNEPLNVLKTNIFDKYQRNLEDVNPVPTIRILVARFDQVKYVADHDDRVEEEAKVLVASIISGLSNLAGKCNRQPLSIFILRPCTYQFWLFIHHFIFNRTCFKQVSRSEKVVTDGAAG